jgi:uncharacterized repeat protein (TIGR03803 family)
MRFRSTLHICPLLAVAALCLSASARGQDFQLLHQFQSTDGTEPSAGLILAGDSFYYGTTVGGGNAGGGGTIYKIDSSGNLTTLYSYSNFAYPYGALVQGSDGNFYGTTSEGGANSLGSVFQMTPAGIQTTIHDFAGTDGEFPFAGLIQATDGFFYGTTQNGGSAGGHGTVFKIDSSGNFTSLHSFPDFSEPFSPLVQGTDGNFYGTTNAGGTNSLGSVFQITPGGVLTTLHSFSGMDGENPYAGLIQATDGFFYGTAEFGGSAGGQGTIFKIDSSGSFTSLYSFPIDSEPEGSLVEGTDGNFYGTTEAGGANGQGSLFQITPAGVLTTIHDFTGADGLNLSAGLIQGSDGRFYGTALLGGAAGYGTIFSICPTVAYPTISVNLCLPPNTSGISASAPNNVGNSYTWTLTGGTIDAGQGTNSVLLSSGVAGTLMTLSVTESDGFCQATASTNMQVDFNDVPTSSPFYTFICSLARNGVTGGCGGGNFCPNNPVLRSQMAVFLLRCEHGPSYLPPACTVATFTDVPCSNPFSSWIYQMVAEGITSGCTPTTFCPNNSVLRNSMAVFLLVTEHGMGYTPPACTPPGQFTDVPCPGAGFTNWIYQLVAEGITGGCTATTYCPTQAVSRAQMAVFLVVTFNLP